MPSLYNTYGAKTLRSKFCKDKQNYISDTNLLKAWLTRNPIRRFLYIKAGCLCLLIKAFFILLMYCLIRVLAFHSDVSAVFIVGCLR
jgi:hypothetical protein